MSLVSFIAPALMMVTINGVPERDIQFTSKQACDTAKPAVMQQYKYPLRTKVKLKCVKQ